ncbi:MAG: nitrous oxide reductase accessory protein NosL [Acidobacteria bacterium]|nr:nitrous oxide reductase accessory protein NosL [Acidobacteriota bacterium]
MQRLHRIVSLSLFFLAACAAGQVGPVPIDDGDACSFCRMAISERQFAAEIIKNDETVLKFDDIACLLRYRERSEDKTKPAAIFVTDYDTKDWVKAEDAFFMRSETIKTPMGGGILAYRDKAKIQGQSLRFEDLKP